MKAYRVYKAIEGTETYEQYGEDFISMWRVGGKGFPRNEVRAATADELIAAIDDDAEWEPNLVEALCYELDIDFDSYEDCDSAYDAAVAKYAAEALNRVNVNGNEVSMDAAVMLMDDEIREAVNFDIAPCTEQEFVDEYCKRHLEKYGEDFVVM